MLGGIFRKELIPEQGVALGESKGIVISVEKATRIFNSETGK